MRCFNNNFTVDNGDVLSPKRHVLISLLFVINFFLNVSLSDVSSSLGEKLIMYYFTFSVNFN